LIVLLDDWAPSRGAFAHALEWGWHLRLPIHAWAPAVASDEFAEKVNACAKVCADWGVKLGLTQIEGEHAHWLEQHVESDDLVMVSYAGAKSGLSLSPPRDIQRFPAGTERLALIRQLLQQPAAVLICPEMWKSTLSRLLVLYRSSEQNEEMLATVMDVCRCVRAKPVVLTVAGSEREAWRRQQPARVAFADHGQSGNFDLLIGSEVTEAAIRVARWRQCQLVVMGRYGRPPWTHWFSGSTTDRLLGLADSLAVLTIPKKEAPAAYSGRKAAVSNLGEPAGLLGHGEPP
jgi:nucleotide-binding universal stress UspA family protein